MNPPGMKLACITGPVFRGHDHGIQLQFIDVGWLLPWEANDGPPPSQHGGVRHLLCCFFSADHQVKPYVGSPHRCTMQ